MHYSTELKKKLCKDICPHHVFTIKTLEKRITSYNKDIHYFDSDYKTQAKIIND